MGSSLATDPHARFQAIKKDFDELKSEVRDIHKKIDVLIQGQPSGYSNGYNPLSN